MNSTLAEALTALCSEITKLLREIRSADDLRSSQPQLTPGVTNPIPADDRPEWFTCRNLPPPAMFSRLHTAADLC